MKIGLKLFLLVSLIVIVSMGSITWFIHNDTLDSVKKSNININRRLAVDTETAINKINRDTRMFLRVITAFGPGTLSAYEYAEQYFKENPQILAIFFVVPERGDRLYINKQSINEYYAASFFKNNKTYLERAEKGETSIINAASFFSMPYMALYFPFEAVGTCGVLFSSEFLNIDYNSAGDISFLISKEGNILVYPDFSALSAGANIGSEDFIRSVLNSGERSGQRVIETRYRFTQPKKISQDFINTVFYKLELYFYKVYYKLFPDKKTMEKDRYILSFTKINNGAVVFSCDSFNKGLAGLPDITKRFIFYGVIAFLGSLILVIFFSKTITVPLKKLNLLTKSFEKGKFDTSIKSGRSDEVGEVIYNFKRISSALQSFSKFSNRDIALKAMYGTLDAEGTQKQATVFYSRIHEFRKMEDHFNKMFGAESSTKLIPWLNKYYQCVIENTENTNGIVDKFFGDSVMAHWGVASTHGTPRKDAFNCIKAALLMRKAFFLSNKRHKPGDLENPVFQAGYGINSGYVTAGLLGSDERADYSIIGDNVNIALRLKDLTEHLGVDILISEYTWELAGDKFITEEMPPLAIEGRDKPVRIFAVINFVNEPKGPQNIAELRRVLGIAVPESDLLDIEALDE